MGSRPFKSRQEKLNNKQRQIIYEKWKYDIIQCYITFDNIEENKNFNGNNIKDRQKMNKIQ
jgi:hypothetical protein